jgi:hypothetical protein
LRNERLPPNPDSYAHDLADSDDSAHGHTDGDAQYARSPGDAGSAGTASQDRDPDAEADEDAEELIPAARASRFPATRAVATRTPD